MTGNVAGPAVAPQRQRAALPRARRAGAWLDRHATMIALVAVGVSLLIAGGYAIVLGGQLRYFDEQVYVQLTRSIAQGHGFTLDNVQPTAYRPPGYIFLLLPAYLVSGGSVLAMRMIGVLALAGSVWFTYLLGRRVHTAGTGAVAALVVACYPLLVYTATTLYPQVPALFLLLATIETGLRAAPAPGVSGRRRLLMAAVAGLLGGLLTLTVPTFGLTVLGLIVWLARKGRRTDGRVPWRMVAVLVIATAVLPAAWCARNAAQLHAFVPVSTNDGVNLLLGNNPNATADSGTNADISSVEKTATDRRLSEVDLDHYYTAKAVLWIAHNPGHAVVLYAEKVANNFNYRDQLATSDQRSPAKDLVSALTYYPILVLALLRIALYRRWRLAPIEKMLIGTIAVNVLLLAIFFTRLRFRVPLDGLTIVLAASTVTHFLTRHSLSRHTTSRSGEQDTARAQGVR
ncbi:MAG TPA: glycosyltransferase family 39 protein [Pseudonocardiaceae bacterium]|nr:glycosyltransferase family 39 protein [Pseudonocardiaceae bacterium]